jgi:predicted DNA-binding transcriptional regulator AlpA
MGTRLIDIDQLSEKVGLKPKTIRNRLHEETFPLRPVKQGGRKNFWLESDVDKYIENLRENKVWG